LSTVGRIFFTRKADLHAIRWVRSLHSWDTIYSGQHERSCNVKKNRHHIKATMINMQSNYVSTDPPHIELFVALLQNNEDI